MPFWREQNQEPESLWNYGEPEPWRRGRIAILLIFVAILLMDSVRLALSATTGDPLQILKLALTTCFGCLMLYLIWIGQNWARWLLAPFYAVTGAINTVWGIISGRGDWFVYGLGLLAIFCYLAFAPSVYAFARHQRERTGWVEALAIGAGFMLVLASIASVMFGFHVYKRSVERAAVEFAQLTFRRVFINQDAQFLREHASTKRRPMSPEEFVAIIDEQLGQFQSAGPTSTSAFDARLRDWRLAVSGGVKGEAEFLAGAFIVDIRVSGSEGNWAIEQISWEPVPIR